MEFEYRSVNRKIFPQKHMLVCEDVMIHQLNIIKHLVTIFDADGIVQVSLVTGAVAAAAIIANLKIDLILLDHNMPQGNSTDLIAWMKKNNHNIPIIAFAGIVANNKYMGNLGVLYSEWTKGEIINGQADNLIRQLLCLNPRVIINDPNELIIIKE